MVSIHFDEYLRTLYLTEEKTKVRPPLLALTRKNSGISANLDTLTVWINGIYQLIKSNLGKNSRFNPQDKIREFNRRLHNLKDKLIFFCEEPYIRDKQVADYSVKSGEQLFSEFLQHLFIYTTEHIKDTIYISQLMEEILVNYTADFFYSLVEGENRSITVWIDPLSKSTALLAVAQVAQPSTFNMFTDVLNIVFLNNEASLKEVSVVSPDLHRYLLQEDEEGFSTLSIIWARADLDLTRLFLGWVRRFYGDSESLGFKRFLFQIDEEGLSSLIRAVEREDLGLVCLLFEGVKQVYGSETERGFQQFLFYQDKSKATILNRVSRLGNYVLTKKIIATAAIAFKGKDNPDFQDFLFLPDIEGNTALISAAQGGHRKLLKLLSREAEQAYKDNKQELFQFMLHQNKDGFNVVMRAVEMGQRACVGSLLNLLLDFLTDSPRFLDVVENSFKLQTKDGFSLLHLAVQCRSVEMLAFLLIRLHELFDKELTDFCSLKDKDNLTPLESMLYEEKNFRIELKEKNRLVTSQEKIASKQRIAMIREFLTYDIQLPHKDSFFILNDVFTKKTKSHFFSIFCFRSRRMARTTQLKACVFNNEDYDAFFPKDFSQIRKEALVNLVSFLQKSHFSFINQIAFIRNSDSTLQIDQLLLKNYKESVNQFYGQYGSQILSSLKRTSVIDLESAWRMTHTDDLLYILADNGHDLLIFNKKGVFSANLLNPTQSVGLRYHLSGFELNDWLTRYFSPEFTLYAFYPSVLAEYPAPFDQLKLPFFFDENYLVKKIRGLHHKTIQDLFLIEGNKIQLADFSTPDFFSTYARKIGFRPEKFYDIYFKLDLNEKLNLQRLFKKQVIPVYSYLDLNVLTVEEKSYFNLYGAHILRLLTKNNDFSPIYLEELFDSVLDCYENILEKNNLSILERKKLLFSLKEFKLKSQLFENADGRVLAQLVLFLLPNFMRVLANKDPLELSIPIGLIGADLLLKRFLVGLTKHPQFLRLLDDKLGNKAITFINSLGERVPLIGSVFAVYGLLESGKVLATTDKQDPNRPYYAHLLVNNLMTFGAITADIIFSLPFWPIFGLFTVLTADQIITEGKRVYNNVLHLKDDQEHPLRKFYTELELGLGIVDTQIELIEEQRVLFQMFLTYLERVQIMGMDRSLIVVTLPEVQTIQVPRIPIQSHDSIMGCSKEGSTYSATALCKQTELAFAEKNDYDIQLGEITVICERDDPYYLDANQHKNITLLTGDWVTSVSPNSDGVCEVGQMRIREAIAKATGKAGAAIIFDERALVNHSTQNYTLFIPLDPRHIHRFSVSLQQNIGPYTQTDLLLPDDSAICSGFSISSCIDRIVVAITPLYSVVSNNNYSKTEVSIQGISVQEVQYLISYAEQVVIHESNIPKKTFKFFNTDHYLMFEDNVLKSSNGFQVVLENTSSLILDFDRTAYLEGSISAEQNQTMVIRHLKGISSERFAHFNATTCSSFAASLGQYTRFEYKEQRVVIRAETSEALINVYAAYDMPVLYYFMWPLNGVTLQAIEVDHVSLIVSLPFQETLVPIDLEFSLVDQQIGWKQVFSGHYRINDKTLYNSRIVLEIGSNQQLACWLDIDASMGSLSDSLDVTQLQAKNFKKVRVLSRRAGKLRLTHYLFYQGDPKPIIKGQFSGYQLKERIEDWVLILRTPARIPEETWLFLDESVKEIIIQSIRYKIDYLFSSLFAIGAEFDSVIDVNDLLAPIKIEKLFNDVLVTRHHGLYEIEGLRFKRLTSKVLFQFDDGAVPGPFLAYQAVIKNQTLEEVLPAYSHYRNTQHSLELPPRTLLKEATESRGMWKDLTYGLLGTAGFIGMGLAALFIKRFRRSSGQAIALHAGTILPLLEIQQAEALEKKQENKAIHLPKIAWILGEETDFSYLSFIRGCAENKSLLQEIGGFRMKAQPLRTDPYETIDQQLMLGFWLGRHIEKLFFKSCRHKSHFYRNKEKTDVYFANQLTRTPSFFSQSGLFVGQNPSLSEEKSLNFSHYTPFN